MKKLRQKLSTFGFFPLLMAELAVLLCFGIFIASRKDSQKLIEMPLDSFYLDAGEREADAWHFTEGCADLEGKDSITVLRGPYIDLPRGNYTITISYESEDTQEFWLTGDEGTGAYIRKGEAKLPFWMHTVTYHFEAQEKITNFKIFIKYNNQGDFVVRDIQMRTNRQGYYRTFLWCLLLFILADTWIFLNRSANRDVMIILAVAFISSVPLLNSGIAMNAGQDLQFHLNRIEGLAQGIREGIFPVRIASYWFGGYGYPVSIYYGDVFLYFPALLRVLGVTVTYAYKAFLAIANIITAASSYLCFRKISGSRLNAAVCSLAYCTSTYRFVDLYIRSAVGEYMALAFYPVIALAVYKIYSSQDLTFKEMVKYSLLLSAGMSLLLANHLLSTEMAIVVLVFVCLLFIRKTLNLRRMGTFIMAIAESFFMSAYFVIPFLDYYLNVPVRITSIVNGNEHNNIQYTYNVARIGDYLAFFKDPFGRNSIHHNRSLSFTPGIVLMVALVCGIWLIAVKKADKKIRKMTILSLCILLFASELFPWNGFAVHTHLGRFVEQVQFAWRYIGIANLTLSILLLFIMKESEISRMLEIKKRYLVYLIWVTCIFSSCWFAGVYFDDAEPKLYYDTAELDNKSVGNGEYMREGADEKAMDGEFIASEGVKIEDINRKGTSMTISCRNMTDQVQDLTFPVMNYKGYEIEDEAGREYPIKDGRNMQISVEVPAQFEGILNLSYQIPKAWNAAMILSWFSWLIAVLALWILRDRTKPGPERISHDFCGRLN